MLSGMVKVGRLRRPARELVTGLETIVTNAIDEPIPTRQRDPPAAPGRARPRNSHLRRARRADPRGSAAAHRTARRMGDRQDDVADALAPTAATGRRRRRPLDGLPAARGQFLAGLITTIDAELTTDWRRRVEVEIGLDIGIADARIRQQSCDPARELRAALRHLVERRASEEGCVVVLLDDVDLLPDTGDALLRLRACALELYAADLPLAFVIAAGPGLFTEVRSAHEPLVRFFEPLSVGPLDDTDTARALTEPLGA